MQVTETNTEGLKREFKIVVPATEVQERIDGRLSELGRRIRLPGFRPGKVPLPLLKQRYGQSVRGEVLEQAVNDSSAKLITERGLRAAGQPKIEILSQAGEGDLEYKLAIELMPDIKPVDFKTLEFERLVVEVPEKEVSDAIERAAKRFRKSNPIATPRPAQTGDVVVIDFVGRIDGKEFPGGAATGHHLELGSGSFIPGFEDQLVGAGAATPRCQGHLPGRISERRAGRQGSRLRRRRQGDPRAGADRDRRRTGQGLGRRRCGEPAREHPRADRRRLRRRRAQPLKRHLLDALAARHEFECRPAWSKRSSRRSGRRSKPTAPAGGSTRGCQQERGAAQAGIPRHRRAPGEAGAAAVGGRPAQQYPGPQRRTQPCHRRRGAPLSRARNARCSSTTRRPRKRRSSCGRRSTRTRWSTSSWSWRGHRAHGFSGGTC